MSVSIITRLGSVDEKTRDTQVLRIFGTTLRSAGMHKHWHLQEVLRGGRGPSSWIEVAAAAAALRHPSGSRAMPAGAGWPPEPFHSNAVAPEGRPEAMTASSEHISMGTVATSEAEEGYLDRGALRQIMLGTSPGVSRALAAHRVSWWCGPAHWLDAVLRATGAPYFLNNPFSGALILVAMAVDDSSGPEGAGATVLGATCALLAALLLGERWESTSGLSSGALTYNGALIGVTVGSGSALHHQPWLLAPIVVLCVFSAWLSRSLSASFARMNLPPLNSAFNALCALWFTVETRGPRGLAPPPSAPANVSAVDWAQVASSVIMAPGPVYACSTFTSCCLLYVAFLVFSPLLFVVSLVGAIVGAVIGVLLCPGKDLDALYSGSWSYCPLLTAIALGCVYFVFNARSMQLAIVGAATACLTYGALLRTLRPLGVPVLGWPFALATWMLVANPSVPVAVPGAAASRLASRLTRCAGPLLPVRPDDVTTPEEARRRARGLG